MLAVGGLVFAAGRSGALFLESERMLVVADLHLEKGAAYAARGRLLPPYDSRQTLASLTAAIARFRPAMVVALGDSVHDPRRAGTLHKDDAAVLAGLQRGRDWIWVAGNHDPELPPAFGGTAVAELAVAGVALRHAPDPRWRGPEISGHLHPAGKVRGPGRSVRRRCWVSDGKRCVMPAFGAYAGGLNILDAAFAPLFPSRFTAHLLGSTRVYAVGPDRLARD
jgi:DNA ligase-associated metallophosphoesterase